jgi:hypothetical protein
VPGFLKVPFFAVIPQTSGFMPSFAGKIPNALEDFPRKF